MPIRSRLSCYQTAFAAALLIAPITPAQAMSLDAACARFASRLQTAVQSGDTAKAQKIYQVGSQRIASNFNGATCPNVQPPAGSN